MSGIGMLLFGIRDLAGWFEKQSRFKRWFNNGNWLNYKPDQPTESRKTAARHAWITFSAMLLLGPSLGVVGFDAFTEAYSSLPWTFASLFLLALLSTILFSHSVGLRRDNGDKSNSMRLYLTLAVSTLVGTVIFAMAAVTLSVCYDVPNLDSNLPTGVAVASVGDPCWSRGPVGRHKPAHRRGVITGAKLVQVRLAIAFFAGELVDQCASGNSRRRHISPYRYDRSMTFSVNHPQKSRMLILL
jgi:hypothetical protein